MGASVHVMGYVYEKTSYKKHLNKPLSHVFEHPAGASSKDKWDKVGITSILYGIST